MFDPHRIARELDGRYERQARGLGRRRGPMIWKCVQARREDGGERAGAPRWTVSRLSVVATVAAMLVFWWLTPVGDDRGAESQLLAERSVAGGSDRPLRLWQNWQLQQNSGENCGLRVSDSGRLDVEQDCVFTRQRAGYTIRMASEGRAVLDISRAQMKLEQGRVFFAVERSVPSAGPLYMAVGPGVVTVVGTKYWLSSDGSHGELELLEGRVQFTRSTDGTVWSLAAGERLSWRGSAIELEPSLGQASQPPQASSHSSEDSSRRARQDRPARVGPQLAKLSRELEQLTHLRRTGQLAAARRQIQRLMHRIRRSTKRERVRAPALEVLSYELGLVLELEKPRSEAVCGHWRKHLRKFHHGSYQVAVERRIRAAACLRAPPHRGTKAAGVR